MNYLDQLRQSAKQSGSIICMELDPVFEQMPQIYANFKARTEGFFEILFKKMKDEKVLPGAFKLNDGSYSRHDTVYDERFQGSLAMAHTIKRIKEHFPEIPVILDSNRADTAEGLGSWKADAVIVSPYMGTDSVMPFFERRQKNPEFPAMYCNEEKGKGVYVLTRTLNPGAKDFQNLKVVVGDVTMPLYRVVAKKVVELAKDNPGVGSVVGATSPDELSDIAQLYAKSGAKVPLLIPGVGKQGGTAPEVMERLRAANYDLSLARINSSSGIIAPWGKEPAPKNWADMCIEQLVKLNEEIGYKAA